MCSEGTVAILAAQHLVVRATHFLSPFLLFVLKDRMPFTMRPISAIRVSDKASGRPVTLVDLHQLKVHVNMNM